MTKQQTTVTTVRLAQAIPSSDKVIVHTQIINQLDGRIIVDNAPGVEITNYNAQTMIKNADFMADTWPDCQITISVSNGDFACIPPRNMMKDEKTMSFEDFMAKWYDRKRTAEDDKLQWEYMNGEYPEDF